MIVVTDSAKDQAQKLMKEDGKDGLFIRVGVEGGGCSGLMYQLIFDNVESESDKAFENNGLTIVVDKKSYLYLINLKQIKGIFCDVKAKSISFNSLLN